MSRSGRTFTTFLSLADFGKSPTPDLFDICTRWGLPRTDPNVEDVVMRLRDVWRRWTSKQRLDLLSAVEAIAEAETAKKSWKPSHRKPLPRRVLNAARLAIDAARLADRISMTFPPPWRAEDPSVGHLVSTLVMFAGDALGATSDALVDAKRRWAARELIALRKSTSKNARPVSRQLLAELTWLCLGMVREPVDEKTIRRYETSGKKRVSGPTAALWRKHWPLMHRVASASRQAPQRAACRFHESFERYIQDNTP